MLHSSCLGALGYRVAAPAGIVHRGRLSGSGVQGRGYRGPPPAIEYSPSIHPGLSNLGRQQYRRKRQQDILPHSSTPFDTVKLIPQAKTSPRPGSALRPAWQQSMPRSEES